MDEIGNLHSSRYVAIGTLYCVAIRFVSIYTRYVIYSTVRYSEQASKQASEGLDAAEQIEVDLPITFTLCLRCGVVS